MKNKEPRQVRARTTRLRSETSDLLSVLEWDTRFFGVRIARLRSGSLNEKTLDDCRAWIAENDVHCVYYTLEQADVNGRRIAEEAGFRLVDVRTELDSELSGSRRASLGSWTDVGPCTEQEAGVLGLLARSIHRGTRFFNDPGFTDERCRDLYEEWIVTSVRGYADVVLVARRGGPPIGYLSCHVHGAESRIGLFGVSPEHRNSGAGTELLRAALEWGRRGGLERLAVVTSSNNVPALRLYEEQGFRTVAVELCYHLWPDDTLSASASGRSL